MLHEIDINELFYNLLYNFRGGNNLKLKYITLFTITFFLALSSHNAFGVNSINWTLGGSPLNSLPFPTVTPSSGNLLQNPISILVDATDESDYTTNNVIDSIDVLVSSVGYPDVITYTLTETGINTGLFTGTNFVFLVDNSKFQTTDTIDVIIDADSDRECYPDDTITQLDSTSVGADDGVLIFSNTDLGGVGLVLTETGENTCKFIGKLKFTTTDSTDEITGTLKVSPGDILTVFDPIIFSFTNAQIIPTVDGKGSIQSNTDDNQNTAEVSATYNGLSAGLHMADDPGGSGSGGPINRPGLVLNFLGSLLGGSSQSVPPTLGLDENQRRIVDGGFSFNHNSIDVEQFYTHYPLITTPVGQNNTIKLKIYEDKGINNIAHVGLSYGLGKGETFNEGRATIEYDKTFDGKESVTLFDPKHVLGGVNVTSTITNCSTHNNAQCLEVTFDHIFREPLEYNMIATNIWNFERNGWQNYFNHGIQIVGESMNPSEKYSGIYRGHPFHLTESGKNTAIDGDGNNWTFDKIWNRDYIKPVNVDSDILNPEKISAIEQLGFKYSDGQEIFGYARIDHRFEDTKNQEQVEAQTIMDNLCPGCQKEPFEKINDIFSYNMPTRHSKLNNPETVNQMNHEDQKAREFLKQYFEKIYPGKIYD
jgi:hypothetical protein